MSLASTLAVVWLSCVVAAFVLPRYVQVFDFVEKWLADLRVAALTPPMVQRSDIVLLTITEETLRKFPYRSPIDRAFLADVVEYMDAAGVRAIGLDILIDQPTEPEKDARLARTVANARAPIIVGWADIYEGLTKEQVAFLNSYLPRAIKAHVNLVKDDRDGTVRWIFRGRETDGVFRPGFALALAQAGGVEVPDQRSRLLYRRGTDGSVAPFPTFPIHLIKSLPQQWFANKIVLIGADLSTEDRHRTPYATMLGNYEGSVPGVVIHALALAQMIDGVEPRDAGLAFEMSVGALAAAMGILLAMVGFSVIVKAVLTLLTIGALWFAGFATYAWGGPLFPLFVPSVLLIISAGIGNAITSQRYKVEAELAETAVRARSEFLAMMSHEIRTPMNGVLGVIELLRGSGLTSEQSQMATIVQDSAKSLLGILNDILDFSKIEAGRIDINRESTSIRRTAEGVIATFAVAADGKGIGLDLDIQEDVPDWLMTDPVRLRQILVNLLGNAIKFTEKGTVKLTCRRAAETEPGQGEEVQEGEGDLISFEFIIEDSGIGMSPAALKRLFRPFTQADGSTTRRFGGTGLGLTISKQLVELMDGDVDVDSREGKGSTFTVTLPMAPSEAPAEGESDSLPDLIVQPVAPSVALDFSDELPVGGKMILVAEDNPTNQWLVRKQLIQLGYGVKLTADGKAALDAFRSDSFDLVLTDFHMPEMDGLDLARAIRKSEADSSHRTPILALTANVLPEIVEQCSEAGIDGVLTKPTQLSLLERELKKWIEDGDEDDSSRGFAPGEQAEPETGELPEQDTAVPCQAAHGNGEPVLDLTMFEEMFGGIDDDIKESLAGYVTGAGDLVNQIDHHMSALDAQALSKVAHRLAGESLSAGAMALGNMCKDLERAATEENWSKAKNIGPQVGGAFEKVRIEIANL